MESERKLGLETSCAINGHHAVFNITKVYGQLEFTRDGKRVFGGVTWEPDGRLPIAVQVGGEEVLTAEQASILFKDLLQTLMPSVELLEEIPDF